MPSIVKDMGKAKAPSFYKGGASSSSTPTKSKNLPILVGIVALGAGLVLYLRSRDNMSSSANVGPALTIVPTTDADQSNIANMIQALKAIGQIHAPNSQPGGGTTTPITQTPNPANSGSTPGSTQSTNQTIVTDLSGKVYSWSEYNQYKLSLMQAAGPNTPYADINRQIVAKFGGYIYPGQGPEENLSVKQYGEMVLGQIPGQNPNLLKDPTQTYDQQAWLDYLLRIGPTGYVGANSGTRDDGEYYRNLEYAKQAVGK